MPINYQQDKNGTVRDPGGRTVGKVDMHGQVRDGSRDKGHIDSDGKYHDEYGRDRGWTVQGGGDSSGVGSGCAIALIFVLFASLLTWILSSPTRRRVAVIASLVMMGGAIIWWVGTSAQNATDAQARQRELEQVLANPGGTVTIVRLGDGPCSGEQCGVKAGQYMITNNLRVMNLRVSAIAPCNPSPGPILGPQDAVTTECTEDSYGTRFEQCYYVSVVKQSMSELDLGKICYRQ